MSPVSKVPFRGGGGGGGRYHGNEDRINKESENNNLLLLLTSWSILVAKERHCTCSLNRLREALPDKFDSSPRHIEQTMRMRHTRTAQVKSPTFCPFLWSDQGLFDTDVSRSVSVPRYIQARGTHNTVVRLELKELFFGKKRYMSTRACLTQMSVCLSLYPDTGTWYTYYGYQI